MAAPTSARRAARPRAGLARGGGSTDLARSGRHRPCPPASAPPAPRRGAGRRQRPTWPTFGRRRHAEMGRRRWCFDDRWRHSVGRGWRRSIGQFEDRWRGGGFIGLQSGRARPRQPSRHRLIPVLGGALATMPATNDQMVFGACHRDIQQASIFRQLRRPRGRPTGPGPTIVIAATRWPQQQRRARRIGVPNSRASISAPAACPAKIQSAPAGPWRRARHDPHLAAAGALQIAFHLKLGGRQPMQKPLQRGDMRLLIGQRLRQKLVKGVDRVGPKRPIMACHPPSASIPANNSWGGVRSARSNQASNCASAAPSRGAHGRGGATRATDRRRPDHGPIEKSASSSQSTGFSEPSPRSNHPRAKAKTRPA